MYRCRQWQSQVVEMQEVGNATNPNLARCTFWYSGHYDDDCDGGHYDNQNLSRFPNLLFMLAWKKEEEYVDAVLAYDDSVYCVHIVCFLTQILPQ